MPNPINRARDRENFIRLAYSFFGSDKNPFKTAAIVAVFFVVAGWFPDGVTSSLKVIYRVFLEILPSSSKAVKWLDVNQEFVFGMIQLIIPVIIMIIIAYVIYKNIRKPDIIVLEENLRLAKVLTIILSPINVDTLIQVDNDNQDNQECTNNKKTLTIKEAIYNSGVNNYTTREALRKTSWDPPIQAIEYHVEKLKRIYIIASKGNDGSRKLVDDFIQAVNKIFYPKKIEEIFILEDEKDKGLEIDNMEVVFDHVHKMFDEIKMEKWNEEDIVVDITGGLKPTSIAVAIATLDYDRRRFQYIEYVEVAGEKKARVRCYNVHVRSVE